LSTGKTTYLSKTVRDLVREHGPDSVMIASFSVTAAQEIGSRFGGDGPKPNAKSIGTLHSHAYRSLGSGSVALEPKIIADWNAQNPTDLNIKPQTRGSGHVAESGGAVSDPSKAVTGDQLLTCLDRARASMTPRSEWPVNLRTFADRWEAWKRDASGALDFTDMVEMALERARDGESAPGKPRFLLADEAQDMTPLEVALTTAWGEQAEQLIIGMDDDQAIMRWRGGDPTPLLTLEAAGDGEVRDHVLDQSWRIPSSVHAIAERWVHNLSMRREKLYHPRDEVGAAFHVQETIRDAELVRRIEADLATGASVMVLSSCNYMLKPLTDALRSHGLPFHNPYRPGEMAWNPLGAREAGVSTAERIYRYLVLDESLEGNGGRFWTGGDVQSWAGLIKLSAAGMRKGAKKMIDLLDPASEVPFEDLAALFASEESLEAATAPSLNWLGEALLAGKREAASYPMTVARMHGPSALAQTPRLTVGTIHSVKGGDSDIVYVDPSISRAARTNAASTLGRDDLIRQFYVAMTRAKHELRLLSPVSDLYVHPRDLLPTNLEVMPS
jgi:superfamily I DNA/RNA helicase